MPIQLEKLFPTLIARGSLPDSDNLNRKLLKDIYSFFAHDKLGKSWSQSHYRGGYTSYASLSDLHYRTPHFDTLARCLQPHAEGFARAQGWKMNGLVLEMTALWINLMPKHAYHTLHLHPHSVLSGTYYVRAPKGSVALKIEDPRMGFYMNAPPRVNEKRKEHGLYYEITPKAGTFVLFESWLRHEVPPNQSSTPRISLSFNYSLAEK